MPLSPAFCWQTLLPLLCSFSVQHRSYPLLVSFSAPAFQLCQIFCNSGLTQRMFSQFVLLPRLCLCCPKVPLLSCSSQPKLGARRMVNPLAFCDLSLLSALSMPLQTAGPQKLEQPWRLADFSYRGLGHAQHQVCTASILVKKNLNHSFLEVVRCFSQVQRWPKSHKALLVPIRWGSSCVLPQSEWQ